jgi:hypothetical protein
MQASVLRFPLDVEIEAVGIDVLSRGPCNHPFDGSPGLPVVIPAAVGDLI